MATSRPGLGYPAVNTPRPGDATGLATAISNARQRLEAIEATVTTLQNSTAASTATQQISAIAAQVAALTLEINSFSTAADVDTEPYVAGEVLNVFEPVVPSSTGRVVAADPSDPLSMFGVIGITITNAALGATVTVQRRGPVAIPGASFVDQRAVYATATGLTQMPDPALQATVLPIGVAIDATTLYVLPQWPALLGLPIESAVGDAYLKFLPVTYSLIADLRALIDHLETQIPGPAIWTGALLTTDPTALSALPSGGLNGTEIVLVERDGQWVHTTTREFALYVIGLLSVSG